MLELLTSLACSLFFDCPVAWTCRDDVANCSPKDCALFPGYTYTHCKQTCGNCDGRKCNDSPLFPCHSFQELQCGIYPEIRDYCPLLCGVCIPPPGSETSAGPRLAEEAGPALSPPAHRPPSPEEPAPLSAASEVFKPAYSLLRLLLPDSFPNTQPLASPAAPAPPAPLPTFIPPNPPRPFAHAPFPPAPQLGTSPARPAPSRPSPPRPPPPPRLPPQRGPAQGPPRHAPVYSRSPAPAYPQRRDPVRNAPSRPVHSASQVASPNERNTYSVSVRPPQGAPQMSYLHPSALTATGLTRRAPPSRAAESDGGDGEEPERAGEEECEDERGDCSRDMCDAKPGEFLLQCRKTCANCYSEKCFDSRRLKCREYSQRLCPAIPSLFHYCPSLCGTCRVPFAQTQLLFAGPPSRFHPPPPLLPGNACRDVAQIHCAHLRHFCHLNSVRHFCSMTCRLCPHFTRTRVRPPSDPKELLRPPRARQSQGPPPTDMASDPLHISRLRT